MPELPEVETVKRQLASVLPHLEVVSVEVKSRKVLVGDSRQLIGKKVKGLRRFGKMLVIDFTGGISLAVHLKMTGRLIFDNIKKNWEVEYPNDKHTHVIITFTNGDHLYYHDVRKFGWLQVVNSREIKNLPYVKKLGPEFFNNLTIQQFNNIVKKNSQPIKLVLMDQEQMAGVGNIYANEALWCAKIHPKQKAKTLLDGQMVKLFECLEQILKQAIKWRGASENNYRDAFGQKGEVQKHFNVYSREGEPCPRCRHLIQKFRLASRGTYYCPNCQKLSN